MSIKTEPYYFAVVNEDGWLIDGTISRWERKARWHAMPFGGAWDWEHCAKRGWRVVKVAVSEAEPANDEAVRIAELERERDALIRDNASYVEAAASEASRAEAAEARIAEPEREWDEANERFYNDARSRADSLSAALAAARPFMAGEGVTVKPLEWRDQRGHSFPDKWDARTPVGVYEIEERSASDSPAYVVTGPLYAFLADTDGLDDAKAAAQADYEARIRSALAAPLPDTGTGEVARLVERLTGTPDRMTAIDRLRLYATDDETWHFDFDDAAEVVELLDDLLAALTRRT